MTPDLTPDLTPKTIATQLDHEESLFQQQIENANGCSIGPYIAFCLQQPPCSCRDNSYPAYGKILDPDCPRHLRWWWYR